MTPNTCPEDGRMHVWMGGQYRGRTEGRKNGRVGGRAEDASTQSGRYMEEWNGVHRPETCLPGTRYTVLRGTIVNRTYDTDKKLHIYLFFIPIFRPIYYGPPK